jgi:hypothetical protein
MAVPLIRRVNSPQITAEAGIVVRSRRETNSTTEAQRAQRKENGHEGKTGSKQGAAF